MKIKNIIYSLFFLSFTCFSQQIKDTLKTSKKDLPAFKKRVLEAAEVDILSSIYTQNGDHAAVTGGIGTEQLNDYATNINIAIPLNDDDVLSIDATVSAYTSASSSNLNPFYNPLVNRNNNSENNDDDDRTTTGTKNKGSVIISGASTPSVTGSDIVGTPWAASTGASYRDVWVSGVVGYSHSSDSRNTILDSHISFANEFDYQSFGLGAGISQLFNEKNTEIGIKTSVYLDTWKPQYPTEIKTYIKNNGNLNADFFRGIPIYDQNGLAINKTSAFAWKPVNNQLVDDKGRNTYAISLSFSQILSKRLQISIFSDIEQQKGWLSNPMQRVYFKDKRNFFIGSGSGNTQTYIRNYTNKKINQSIFQLADDIERLPKTRLKIPVGARAHYFINENIVLKTYYRYYSDDWGIKSQTFNIELPIKFDFGKYTIYPNYRYYTQTASTYFAPFEEHISTEKYYTSDYDLSKFNSQQYGIGFKYTDILSESQFLMFGLKSVALHYNYYQRNNGLKAHIVNLGVTLVMQ